MRVTAEVKELTGQLADLLKQVQAGNEVLLTHGDKAVARLVPAAESTKPAAGIQIRSMKGHQVLKPTVSQAELAEELFRPE